MDSHEWETELRVLFEEILDANGNVSRDVYTADSEANVAYQKIRAVYYGYTKEEFAASSVEKLMREQHVRRVLGSVQQIREKNCDVFYRRLQHYVDSKEKPDSTEKRTEDGKKSQKREMEFWPLIKVVRIFVKADALSTGAVIVDLPGVADSNAARAAVAEGYMKQCTGLWIVAPITRAVDDKAAKNLLGEGFRRQLKYDGTYSAITFICSKTDDISNTEATDSLGLADRMTALDDDLDKLESELKQRKKQLDKLKDQKVVYRTIAENAEEQQDVWEQLRDDYGDGKPVYAPAPKSSKRKRGSSHSDDGSDYEEVRPPIENDTPLTEDEIESRISEFKAAKKDARRGRNDTEAQIKDLNMCFTELNSKMDTVESKRSAICIAGRNRYSKSAIQVDFAAGVKELDQENQADENPDDFDPEEDLRDYEVVANSLPVFCVSSRAYQKLSGRLVKDHAVKGFTHVDETEIPALQAHAKKLTEGTRTSACRRFLNSLAQFRMSINLWALNDGTGVKLTEAQRDAEGILLTRKLRALEKSLESCIVVTLEEMKETLQDSIFEHFDAAIKLASDAAIPTAMGWGAHKSAGGLYWATYKATVRRNGVYAGASGPRDFNGELSAPIYKHLGTGWEKAFQRRLPQVLRTCATAFQKALRAFHEDLETQTRARSGVNPRLGMLAQQLQAYEAVFADLANNMVVTINLSQKEVNREFTPSICQAMEQAYALCAAERGTGSFKRMKDHMASEVDNNKDGMFSHATRVVQTKLNELCSAVKHAMDERTDEIYVSLRRDYYSVLGNNVQVDASHGLPKWERNLRDEIEAILVQSEDAFKEIIDGGAGIGDINALNTTEDTAADADDEAATVPGAEAEGRVYRPGDVETDALMTDAQA